jgi:hypothetical protein
LQATGGIKPYHWAVTTGTLLSGLALNGTTGATSGTVTAAGASSFTVTDSETPPAKTATAHLSITITSKIQHVVVIVPENCAPDNLFQDPIFCDSCVGSIFEVTRYAARTIAAAVRARKL